MRSPHWLRYAQHEEGISKSELPENGPDCLTKSKLCAFRDMTGRQRRSGCVCVYVCVHLQRQVFLGSLETLYFVHVGVNFTQAILLCLLWSQARLFGLEAGKSIYQLKIWLNSPTHK